jgi:AbrB family looped-hinge helix DNA binding protein
MKRSTVQLRQRGVLTLPARLREKYRLEEGDALTVLDLDGAIVLSPRAAVVPKLAAEIERLRTEAGLSVEDLLEGLPRYRPHVKRAVGPRSSRGRPRARR